MLHSKVCIVLPVYNEARVLAQTIHNLRTRLAKDRVNGIVTVVDDGSQDNSYEIALKHADYVLRHRHNCGLGAAIATGLAFARRQDDVRTVVTFDADGQHDPTDIIRALEKIDNGYDVIIGTRFRTVNNIPTLRRLILQGSNILTTMLFGVRTSDSQSGFRVLSRQAIERMYLVSNRMEVSSEFFAEIKKKKLKYAEIPITVRYTTYSLRKGQSNANSLNVLLKLFYLLAR